ncbi:hypothetical protein BpHYR1_036885 [Brachionus plicatilis]|uniref:Uncharacterized protein n=1 Tax=Brachionus plicatilis TaxID=10195 RepID=A0A3M7QSF2_BRAPC|nr:hypothetical protein BpHYR1_036885 [Brachionus plicatilis]
MKKLNRMIILTEIVLKSPIKKIKKIKSDNLPELFKSLKSNEYHDLEEEEDLNMIFNDLDFILRLFINSETYKYFFAYLNYIPKLTSTKFLKIFNKYILL